MAGFSDDDLIDFAKQCVNGNISLCDFGRMIAAAKGRTFTRVMFGELEDESEARALLKEAETASWRNRKR